MWPYQVEQETKGRQGDSTSHQGAPDGLGVGVGKNAMSVLRPVLHGVHGQAKNVNLLWKPSRIRCTVE